MFKYALKKNISIFMFIFIAVFFVTKDVFTAPDINIVVVGPSSISIGNPNPYTYTVTLTNPVSNTVTATNTTLDLILGTDFNYFSTASFKKNGVNVAYTTNTASNVTTFTPSSSLSLMPGDTLELIFNAKILCNASSIPLTAIARFTGDSGMEQKTAFQNIEVLKGATLIEVTPSTQTASAEDNVTWLVKVTNSGLGDLYNLNINDTVGSGITNLSLTPGPGSPSFTQTGNSFTGVFPLIPSGESRTFTVSGKVSGCNDLNNNVTTSWPSGAICDNDSAMGSVAYIPKDPGISYTVNGASTPTNINIDWGNILGTPVSVQVTNSDPGEVRNFKFATNLNTQALTVANISIGWTYSASTGTFAFTGNSPSGSLRQGQSSTLSFTLKPSDASCMASPTGTITWKPSYNDICGSNFEPPTSFITYNTVNNPTLSLTKTSSTGGLSELGESFAYNIQLNTTNSGNITGNVSITDVVPPQFTVTSVSATGGTASFTGQNVTWSVPSSIATGKILTINVIASSNACSANSSYVNTAFANATTVRGCNISSNSSASVYLQNYGPGSVTDLKYIDMPVTSPYEVCESTTNISYVNEYTFSNSMTGNFAGSVFKEMLNNGQTFVNGSAEYELVNGSSSFTGTYTPVPVSNITLTTPQLEIGLGFLSGAVTNKKLRIRYKLYAPLTGQFNDVSELSINGGTGGCAAKYYQAVPVNITAPSFTVGINNSSWNNTVDDCEAKTITLNVTKNELWDGQNEAKINFDTTNYTYVGNIVYSGFGGLIPNNSQDGNNRVFSFGTNTLTAGGTITFDIKKKCGSPSILNTDMSWKSKCGTTLTSSASNTPVLNRKGKLLLSLTPNSITAFSEDVSWYINVLNSGDGNAYNINVNDVLGSNLKFISDIGSSLPSGTTFTSQPITNSTGTITWTIDKLAPGKTAVIKVNAKLSGLCGGNNNNSVNASYGCNSTSCSIAPSINGPLITLLNNNVLNTLAQISNIKLCGTGKGKLSIKNSGQANSYNLQSMATLPAGMCYVPNSAKISKNGSLQTLFEPVINGQNLTWKFGTAAPNNSLNTFVPLDIAEIEFEVKGECQALTDSRITTETRFAKPCEIESLGGVGSGTTGTSISNISNFDMSFDRPNIVSSMTPAVIKAEAGQSFTFTYTSTNMSAISDAENASVEITLPPGVTYNSSTTSPLPSNVAGQVLTWTGLNIAKNGGNFSAVIGATVNVNGCTVNEVPINGLTRWGCNSSNTCSGTSCQTLSSASNIMLRTKPLVSNPVLEPSAMNACGTFDGGYGPGVFRVTFNNDGPSAYNLNLIDTLPTGYVYDSSYTPVILSPVGSVNPISNPMDGATNPTWNFEKVTEGQVEIRFKVKSVNSGSCITNTPVNLIDLNYDDKLTCSSTPNYSLPQTSTAISLSKPIISLSPGKSHLNYFTSTGFPQTKIIGDGETGVEWEISFRNTGNDALRNFSVSDVVGTSFNSVSATNGSGGEVPSISGNIISWNIVSLAPNDTWSAKITANHKGSNDTTGLTNIATIDGGCPSGCKYQNTIGSGLPYSQTAKASLLDVFSKNMSKSSATIGETFTTTLVANFSGTGVGAYTGVTVSDDFPDSGGSSSVQFISPLGSLPATVTDSAGNVWNRTLPTAPNWIASWSPANPSTFTTPATLTITINTYLKSTTTTIIRNKGTRNPQAGTILTNNASVTYTYSGSPYSKFDSATLIVKEPSLTNTKERATLTTALDSIDSISSTISVVGANDIVGYVLRATNSSNNASTAHDVRLLDIIPHGLRNTPPVITRVLLDSTIIPSSQYITSFNPTNGFWNIELLASNNFNGIPEGKVLEVYYYCSVDSDVEANKTLRNYFQISKTIAGDTTNNEGYSSLPSTDSNNTNDRKYSETNPQSSVTLTTPNLGILKAVTTNITEGNNTLNSKTTIGETVTYKVIFGTANIVNGMFPSGYSSPPQGQRNNNTTNKPVSGLAPLSSPATPISGLPISTFLDVIPDGLEVIQNLSSIAVVSGSTSITPILNYTLNTPNTGRTVVHTNSFIINPNTVLEATIVCRVKHYYEGSGANVKKDDIITNGGGTATNYSRVAHQSYSTNASGVVSNTTLTRTTGTVNLTVTEPVMSISKIKVMPTGDIVSPGDQVTYTLTVNNSGVNNSNTSYAHQIVVNDIMPLGMRSINPLTTFGYSENVSPTVRGYDSVTGRILWIYTDMPHNTTRTITYKGTVDANVPTCTPLINNAQITSYTNLADGINNSGRKIYSVITAPPVSIYVSNLSIQTPQSIQGKAGHSSVLPHVINSCTAGTINLSYLSSQGWSYTIHEDLSLNHDGSILGNPLTSIVVGANVPKYIALKLFVPSNVPQNTVDTVKLSVSQLVGSQTLTSDVSDIITITDKISGQLKLVKTVDKSTAKPGDTLTYNIMYTNIGNSTLSDIIIKDTVPGGTVFQNAVFISPATGSISSPNINATGEISWSISGSLNPGQSNTVSFTVKIN